MSGIAVGAVVQITEPTEAEIEHRPWIDYTVQYVGQIGPVCRIATAGDIRVKLDDGERWFLPDFIKLYDPDSCGDALARLEK